MRRVFQEGDRVWMGRFDRQGRLSQGPRGRYRFNVLQDDSPDGLVVCEVRMHWRNAHMFITFNMFHFHIHRRQCWMWGGELAFPPSQCSGYAYVSSNEGEVSPNDWTRGTFLKLMRLRFTSSAIESDHPRGRPGSCYMRNSHKYLRDPSRFE